MEVIDNYERNKLRAANIWNEQHSDQPAMYVQSVDGDNHLQWRISGSGGGILGYVNLENQRTGAYAHVKEGLAGW